MLKTAKNLKVLTSSIISPAANKLINEFANPVIEGEEAAASNVVSYDAISYSGILDANNESFGKRAIPAYNFEKAKTYTGVLKGIKGQYLIFEDDTVCNIRSNEGYVVNISIL